MGKKSKGLGSIPDRWLEYSSIGRVVEGTRFVVFKTPLKEEVLQNKEMVAADQWWTVEELVKQAADLNMRHVIALTNTSKYYDAAQILQHGMKYKILHCASFGRDPPLNKEVQLFFEIADEFLNDNTLSTVDFNTSSTVGVNTPSTIGVHCTHGVNRSGYMVCRYMMDRLNIPAATAIQRFADARGHAMEKFTEQLLSSNDNVTGKSTQCLT